MTAAFCTNTNLMCLVVKLLPICTQAVLDPIRNKIWVEEGSEENIALAAGGLWASGHAQENKIRGVSKNLG